ncbi:MAG: FtsW/RodA/SpoVE family cell cycle protein [Planctomycetes bacterium]|nr:FtsW/RodA/SpoVE family cell cycle protein [Planctomycetota bacterium]
MNAKSLTSDAQMAGSARWLTAAMLALMGLGVAMVASASATPDLLKTGDDLVLLPGHLTKLVVALAAFLVAAQVRPTWLYRLAPVLWTLALGGLLAVLVIGVSVKGARRWIDLGPMTFQPSEFARVAVVVAIGAWAARTGDGMSGLRRGLGVPLLLAGVPACLTLVEPDFGSTVVMLFMAVLVLWVGGARSKHLLIGFCGASLAALVYGFGRFEHIGKRFAAFGHPEPGSQVWQSLVALGRGGATGVGLGEGAGYVPEAHNDFILSVVGEELGLLGTLAVVALFALFLFHGMRLLMGLRSRFALVVGTGLMLQVPVQAALNIAVVTGSAPPKGLTLPFVSAGGSSLLVFAASTGLFLGLAKWRDEDPLEGAVPIASTVEPRPG